MWKSSRRRRTYLKIVGQVVFTAARRSEETLLFIASRRALGIGGWRLGEVVVWIMLRSRLVLWVGARGGHDVLPEIVLENSAISLSLRIVKLAALDGSSVLLKR